MGRKLREVLDSLPPERRENVLRRRDEILEDIETLKDLRRRAGARQSAIAKHLNVSQPAVSKMERQTDMTLSALRSYVGALGGTVDLVISLPGHRPVRLEALGDLDDPANAGEDSPAEPASKS